LAKRYKQLVGESLNSNDALSSGLRPLPTEITSFASTQAAWRFYKNDSVTLQKLQEPLLQAAHDNAVTHCKDYTLIIHDWSRLNYRKHQSKLDKYQISHETDVGYDLQSSLLISDKTGLPLAPVALRLVTAKGSYSSYQNNALDESVASHLDEVTTCIDYLQQQAFAKPLVHIIDREADSIGHIRQWQENGYLWLTRAKDHTTVTFEKQTLTCPMIANRLSFNKIREVNYHGKSQWQWVAEAKIVITRHAHVRKNQKRTTVAGKPVEARLVVSRVMSDAGTILAQWVLITNVQGVDANEIALWYYWRWKIESFFKLLKSAGQNLESWQQETGLAIAKRLLVVSMACVVVWEIAAAENEETRSLRTFLIKLSGRQMKWGVEFTNPALLAGLWVFLSMLEMMESYSPEDLAVLRKTAKSFFG
jgi:hypothetical protein